APVPLDGVALLPRGPEKKRRPPPGFRVAAAKMTLGDEPAPKDNSRRIARARESAGPGRSRVSMGEKNETRRSVLRHRPPRAGVGAGSASGIVPIAAPRAGSSPGDSGQSV